MTVTDYEAYLARLHNRFWFSAKVSEDEYEKGVADGLALALGRPISDFYGTAGSDAVRIPRPRIRKEM